MKATKFLTDLFSLLEEHPLQWLLIAAVLVPVMLTGCGSPSRVVVLQNLDTKQTVECRVDPLGDIRRRTQIKNCVNAYKAAGYTVVGDSDDD